jgi:predicted DNA-binding transcriptional regulator AlpA
VLRHVEGPDREWLSLGEAASWLGRSEPALRRLVRAGRFPPGVRHGGQGVPLWHWLTVVAWSALAGQTPALCRPPRRGPQGQSEPEKSD